MAFLDFSAALRSSGFERLREIFTGKSRIPVIAGGSALIAAVTLTAFLWSAGSGYSVLFAGLAADEGGRAVDELQKLNIPYRITDGGRVILVPQEEVGFARLQLAARGVPKQDGDQWALLDNESLGVSPFVEQVHYARAVETALARTIRQVEGVVSATVKLALPKETEFLADAPKPSAAVMVRLRPGVQLTTAQIDGIVGLVAGGVPGLARDCVTLVDQSGRILSASAKDGLQQVPQELEIAGEVGRRYDAAITDLLAPVLGRGNFRVAADADIDFAHRQESSVKYGDSHILSRDESVHSHGAESREPIGIPGALSNRPPETPAVTTSPSVGQNSAPASAQTAISPAATPADKPETAPTPPDTHQTTNYDIDRTVQSLDHPSWTLRALNVDVLINNPSRNPIPPERIRAIRTLVGSAIGTGENRHVTVVDLPFAQQDGAPSDSAAPWWQQRWMTGIAQNTLLMLAGLLVLVGGALPLLHRIRSALPPVGVRPGAIEAVSSDGKTEPSMPSLAGISDAFVFDPDQMRTIAANDPARTARVIKEWIARDRSSLRNAG